MKRDMDVIRRIVLELRDAPGAISSVPDVSSDDYLMHAELLIEAGLANGKVQRSGSSLSLPANVLLIRLTWNGHDFADSIKSDTLWDKAKKNVLKPASSWTFGVLCEYLKVEIKRHIPAFDEFT